MASMPGNVFQPLPADVERVGKVVLDPAYAVHTELGHGLLESVYQVAMRHVIESSGVQLEMELKLPILFRGVKLESDFCLDMPVKHNVFAELKSVENMNPVYEA